MNLDTLAYRLDAVGHFVSDEQLRKQVRKQLGNIFDMERSLQRLSIGIATPKDLKNVATTIDEASRLVDILQNHEQSKQARMGDAANMPALVRKACNVLLPDNNRNSVVTPIQEMALEIHVALKEDFAALNSKAGFVRAGYSADLDRWQEVLQCDPKSPQNQALQAKYRELVGSTRLRLLYQPDKGFFIDIPHEENSKLWKAQNALQEMVLFQSLKNSVRYRTEELRELNRELVEAAQAIVRIESDIFDSLRTKVVGVHQELQAMAQALAEVDVVCSHAQVAVDCSFSRPLLDSSRELHVVDGRHAVVEAAHLRGNNSARMRSFVPNSLHFETPPSGASCWLLTGPNMGGKSTFLRQNAHLVLLAQIGSYVPAKFARVGLVDKLFCRVGSADDLASDRSTFMVEMEETATILKQATSRSLVLMDEVGRGTAIQDGVAIAGAVLETLCSKQARTLFATHFTSLSDLIDKQYESSIELYRMEVLERCRANESAQNNALAQLVFSHRVVQGLAAQSYGINTASLAGCPSPVIQRASELLKQLTAKSDSDISSNDQASQLMRIQAILSPTRADHAKLVGSMNEGQVQRTMDSIQAVLEKALGSQIGRED